LRVALRAELVLAMPLLVVGTGRAAHSMSSG
jgi:hypothetical protein